MARNGADLVAEKKKNQVGGEGRGQGNAYVDGTSNSRMVLSLLALMMCRSPGMKRTEETECSWPGKVFVFLYSD